MNVKLNYALCEQTPENWKKLADALPGKVFPSLRETLEAVMEQYGAVVDRRERLIPQPVIYAHMSISGKILQELSSFGKLELQCEYHASDNDS